MKEIIFATTNEAKIKQVGGALYLSGISVVGVNNRESLPEVEEDGDTASENARKKALIYSNQLNVTVFSMDNALYIDGLSSAQQPGVKVRRISGFSERPSDEQMIDYYTNLISTLRGRANGYWEYGICVATPDGRFQESIIRTPRIFVSKRSKIVYPGYPLESIQIEPETGRYMSELTKEEQDIFWQNTIGQELLEFFENISL